MVHRFNDVPDVYYICDRHTKKYYCGIGIPESYNFFIKQKYHSNTYKSIDEAQKIIDGVKNVILRNRLVVV